MSWKMSSPLRSPEKSCYKLLIKIDLQNALAHREAGGDQTVIGGRPQ
jgi:hypothetical protein